MSREREEPLAGAQTPATARAADASAIQQAHIAVTLMEGNDGGAGTLAMIERAIESRDYDAAVQGHQKWRILRGGIDLLVDRGDEMRFDPMVARARNVRARMNALEGLLPDDFMGPPDPFYAAHKVAWLAKIGAPPAAAASLEGTHGDAPMGPALEEVGPQRGRTDLDLVRLLAHGAAAGPLTVLPHEVTDVLGGPLFAKMRTREGIDILLGDPGGYDPVKNKVAETLEALVNDPEFAAGFVAGSVEGVGRAVYDTLKGFVDAARLAAEVLHGLSTFKHLELLRRAEKEIDALIQTAGDAKELLGAFGDRWNATDDRFACGMFRGEVTGYVVAQVAMLVASMGAGAAAEITGPFAGLIRALRWVSNPIDGLMEFAAGARISSEAMEAVNTAKTGARALRTADELAAEAQAVTTATGAAADGERQAQIATTGGGAIGGGVGTGSAAAPAVAGSHAAAPTATATAGAPESAASHGPAAATGAADAVGGRVAVPKPGVYEDIDELGDLAGWTFDDTRVRESDGTIVLETHVEVNGKRGFIERAYSPKTKTFEMRNAFLEKLPRWINEGTPLVDGKGTPTVAYLSMRQMKLLGVDYAAVEHVKMSTIQNVKAIIQMHVLRMKGIPPEIAVLQTHSVQYAETTIVQSGHKIVAAQVSGDIWNRELDFLLKHYEKGDPAVIAHHDQLIREFGEGVVTRDTVVWMNYDIHLDVAPFAPGGGS